MNDDSENNKLKYMLMTLVMMNTVKEMTKVLT